LTHEKPKILIYDNKCTVCHFRFFCFLPPVYSQTRTTTERECALTKDAEIIWDLSEHRWVCCVPEGEDLETCIPITDMKPLPKTSLKPLPPKGKKTIVIPQE
jgi:hypothetical protein